MHLSHVDHESVLEAGLGLFVLGLLGGLLALLLGRASGDVHRGRGHRQAPPQPGDVGPGWQQHIGAVSAR